MHTCGVIEPAVGYRPSSKVNAANVIMTKATSWWSLVSVQACWLLISCIAVPLLDFNLLLHNTQKNGLLCINHASSAYAFGCVGVEVG